jgi:hypothetical protein
MTADALRRRCATSSAVRDRNCCKGSDTKYGQSIL